MKKLILVVAMVLVAGVGNCGFNEIADQVEKEIDLKYSKEIQNLLNIDIKKLTPRGQWSEVEIEDSINRGKLGYVRDKIFLAFVLPEISAIKRRDIFASVMWLITDSLSIYLLTTPDLIPQTHWAGGVAGIMFLLGSRYIEMGLTHDYLSMKFYPMNMNIRFEKRY